MPRQSWPTNAYPLRFQWAAMSGMPQYSTVLPYGSRIITAGNGHSVSGR